MKLKLLGAVVLATMGLTVIGSSSAMATTLEVGGVTKNASVSMEWSLKFVVIWRDTFGVTANSCTASTVKGSTVSPFTGATVGGPLSTLTFSSCSEGNPTTDAAGTLSVERIGSTTNGTVRSNGAKVTVPSFFGTLTCTTSNTDIGTITGVSSGNATVDIKGVTSCTVVGTTVIEAVYAITGANAALGVTA
jgi:hypothetical protein